LRSYIAKCLKDKASDIESNPASSREAAFQLAFCYQVGFGVRKDDERSQAFLSQSLRQHEELNLEINRAKEEFMSLPFQESFRRLSYQGYIKWDLAEYYLEKKLLDNIEAEYRREIADIESTTLGEIPHITSILKLMLSSVLENQGRWKEAEELGVQVVETVKRAFGQESPGTLTSMGNLASAYRNQGRWKEAEELEVQVMETRKRVLGQEHPDTLASMTNLASTYRNQGRWKEAEELEVQVMETMKRVLGQEHPSTLASMGNLASTYRNQGRWKEAEELEVQVMETRKRVLGQEHPNTLNSMANLASTLKSQGRNGEAMELMTNCVQLSTQKLGANHPNTKACARILKMWTTPSPLTRFFRFLKG
jgi:hypothetical protein